MLYTCAPGCRDPQHQHTLPKTFSDISGATSDQPPGESGTDGNSSSSQRKAPRRIDVHCHYLQPAVAAKVAHLEPARYDPSTVFANALTRETNLRQMQERSVALTDVTRRLQDMDRMGVDLQVVSPAPFQYYYFTPPTLGNV